MDLFSIKTIKELFNRQGTRPRKGLGQNFLISKDVLARTLGAAELSRADTVLEIGPGIGTLTRGLAQSAKKVIAVEKDSAMVKILKETTKDFSNVEVIHGDILKLGLKLGSTKEFLGRTKEYKVVANLPYYITSPVIRMFLEAEDRPDLLVLMVQKEVAQRICAKPRTRVAFGDTVRGRPPMNLLAVSVQFYAEPKIISYVKKSCFWPQPKVDSAILKIVPHNLMELSYPQLNRTKFFEVVKAGFKQPRKQLGNNLIQYLPTMLDIQCLTFAGSARKEIVEQWLKRNSIDPTQRAETLSVKDWINLTKSGIIKA